VILVGSRVAGLNPFGSDTDDEEDTANQPVSGYMVMPLQLHPQQPQAQIPAVHNLRGSAPPTPQGNRSRGELRWCCVWLNLEGGRGTGYRPSPPWSRFASCPLDFTGGHSVSSWISF